MSTLSRAISIAAEAHAGQIDKISELYILHPLRVMLSLPSDPPELRIIGVLHDVIEDCIDWTWLRLRSEGFSDEVLSGLDSVTRRKDSETYRDFILRCKVHPLGRIVKLADINDNLSRVTKLPFSELERRYRSALKVLTA